MASATSPFASTKETTNYARLCRLLVDVGSKALRDTFDKVHPPSTLHAVLSSHSVHYPTLQSLYRGRKKVLNPTQWKKLYPVYSPVTSASFDITLLTVLLRNICGFSPPAKGWDSLPPPTDTSIADDIARVKYYRNTVYGHANQASVDDRSFNTYWQEIREALVRLGGTSFRAYINNLEHDTMDPDVEEHYRELMKQWKKDDDNVKEKLEEMEESIRDKLEQMKSEMENNIRGEMKEMKERLDTLTASLKENKNEENLKDKFEQIRGEMVDLGERLENSLENLRIERGESEEKESIRDKLEQMKSEMENNISGKMKEMKERLDILTPSLEENKDEERIRDELKKMKREIENISGKLDALTVSRQETKEEDPFDPSELIDGIRQLYKTREGCLSPFPWCEEFHFQLDNIYTRLKMISRKKARGTLTDEVVNMSAIFKPHEECPQPRTVLIEGKPGMGKTTYCKKFVYDWANGKPVADDCFPKFETVLLLKCRDIKSNIWAAIDDQLLPCDIQEDIREKFFTFIRNNQRSVLLVLDGLDELPASKLPEFSKIIQGRVLPKCHLVATSRHEAGMKVRRYCDTLLEIEGFTEEDARNFIHKYFKTKEDLAQKLLFKVSNDKSLKDLTANPLNTALLCLLCEESEGVFPESTTQLYLDIIECVLRRFRRKKGLPETSEKLTEVYKTQLKFLGRIALNGLRDGNLDFEEHELGKHAHELSGFGFLSLQPGGSKMRPCHHYAFLHKSFQEFFAAYYLCCQLVSQEITPDGLVSDTSYFNELKQVLLFSCGILVVQCEETAVDLIANITTQVNKFDSSTVPIALQCIAECKREKSNVHVTLARVFGSGLKRQYPLVQNTTLREVHIACLAEAIKVNNTLTRLTLVYNDIGAAGAASLAEAMKINKTLTQLKLRSNNTGDVGAASLAEAMKVNETLTQLGLESNNISDAGAASLAEAMKVSKTLTQCSLQSNNIGAAGAASLADAVKVNKTLTQLDLRRNKIGDAGAASLAEAMKVNKTLTQWGLDFNNIGDAGAASLAEAMKVNKTLTWLRLESNNIGDAGAASLAEAMKVNKTLTWLHLESNNIGDAGAASLAEATKVNKTLRQLGLRRNKIGDAGAASLAEAMKVNKTLTQWGLDFNNIGDAGAASLAEAMKVNKTLRQLGLRRNKIGGAGAASLAEAMKVNKTLIQWGLDFNNIGDAGAASLAVAMKVNKTLTLLRLESNNIGDAGAASLAEAMKVNKTLTWLHLESNNIGDAGAASLAEAMKVNKTLTQLGLRRNKIGDAGAASLAEAFKVNKTLTQLHLQWNKIGHAGAASLAEAMKVNKTLTQLNLNWNNIGAADAAFLAEAMKFNRTLAVKL